ncbi:MAG: VanZ family protein [Bacteroidota bacterium]
MIVQTTYNNIPKGNQAANRLTAVLLILYLMVLGWILLLKFGVQFSYMENRRVNLIPFNNGNVSVTEMIMNIVIFVPLGIYTGALFKNWNIGKKLLFIFLTSLIIEGLQFIMAIGAFDITDLMSNTTGGIIGLLVFKAIEKLVNSKVKTQKFINIIAVAGTVIMIFLLVLLKMNMLPVRYQ